VVLKVWIAEAAWVLSVTVASSGDIRYSPRSIPGGPMRVCNRCELERPKADFYGDARGGLKRECKACYNTVRVDYNARYRKLNRQRRNRQSNAWQSSHRSYLRDYWRKYRACHRDEVRERARRWKAENRERVREMERRAYLRRRRRADYKWKTAAHHAVSQAIKSGLLVRGPCRKCGGVAQAHHYKGYEPKHWFHVRWLCARHHREAHGKKTHDLRG